MHKTGMRHYTSLESYDRSLNLMYLPIYKNQNRTGGFGSLKSEKTNHKISNLAIYDIDKDNANYLFPKGEDRVIINYYFEKEYNTEQECMTFNGTFGNSSNNYKIDKRDCVDKMIILTENNSKNHIDFWLSNKKGENPKLIKTYDKNEVSWKLDILNKKIFFIQQVNEEIRIDPIEW